MKEIQQIDDGVLIKLLSLINEDELGIEIEVTLTVSGTHISGIIINPITYFEGALQSIQHIKDHTLQRILTNQFEKLKEEYIKEKEDSEDEEFAPNFIHLKDAVFHTAAGQMLHQNCPIWWRGKISSIDGFSLGCHI
ncbi:hypothetical protein ABET51_14965 [Metabacillus fastidiosus]|uniref:hypothetical protein n=1 Tax=Metabacillus fastidiosus TaxID=1458 RepID=UPI003D2A699E